MKSEIEIWLEKRGIDFLKKIGMEKNFRVLDFGCGEGHYSIPAAKVVGERGIVFAVDKDESALKKVKQFAEKYNLKNIEIIKSETEVPLKTNSVDFVMCFDMLHYLKKEGRERVYTEVYRVLKKKDYF